MVLSLTGWDRYERLKKANPDSTTAFMAMQFGDAQLNRLYREHFRPMLATIGFELHTVEERPEAGLLDYRIRLQVTASRFVIADLTYENRGVYFEAVYAEGHRAPGDLYLPRRYVRSFHRPSALRCESSFARAVG